MNEFRPPGGHNGKKRYQESVSYTTSFLAAGKETDGEPRNAGVALSPREPNVGSPSRGEQRCPMSFIHFMIIFHSSQCIHDIMGEAVAQMDTLWPSQSLVMDVAVQSLSLGDSMNCGTP